MTQDTLTDSVAMAFSAIRAAVPSQAFGVSVEGVRKTAAGSRPVRGSVLAVRSSGGFADPLGDLAVSSKSRAESLLVPCVGDGAWFDETPPQEGDKLTFADGSRFAVTSVESVRGIYFKITARQC